MLVTETRNLNIRYDLPDKVWAKLPSVYAAAGGWLGFGDGVSGEKGIPYWYGYDRATKSISASVEPSGLQFAAVNIERENWETWLSHFKSLATRELGFRVGELELGEVGHEIEWI